MNNLSVKSCEASHFIGLEITCGQNQIKNGLVIQELWKNFNSNIWKIKNRKDSKSLFKFGISYDSNGKEFKYIAAVEVTDLSFVPPGMVTITINDLDFTVFTHVGNLNKLKDTINQIYKVWLPESDFKPIPSSECGINHFEKYDKRFHWSRKDSEIDIYVPIKIKIKS